MAKFSNFEEFRSGKFVHDLKGDGKLVAEMDVNQVIPGFDSMPDWVKQALHFSIKTASRNATAGILKGDPEKALERVQERIKSWEQGTWRASGGGSGESRSSLLARALAEVLGIEVDDAVEQIDEVVQSALDEAGLDRDDEADKAKVRKIMNDVKATIRKDVAVAKVYARLAAEEAAKRSEAAQQATGESTIATMFKR